MLPATLRFEQSVFLVLTWTILFLKLFEPILKNYENYLKEHNEIDFSDMINMATTLISNTQFSSPFKYIIIDEFQDINDVQLDIIKELNKFSIMTYLVGDDLQNIYAFRGSNNSIINNINMNNTNKLQ